MTRVLLLGRVVLDHRFWVERFPPAANRTPTLDYVEAVGGPAAVAAETVAQIGGEAVFIGRRGDDPAGERVETLLRKQAVDTRHLRAVPGARTPVAAVLIDSRGDRFIFPYAGAGLPETTHWIPLRELDRANAVLVDSRWPAGAAVLSRAARAVGLPVVVDLDTTVRRRGRWLPWPPTRSPTKNWQPIVVAWRPYSTGWPAPGPGAR